MANNTKKSRAVINLLTKSVSKLQTNKNKTKESNQHT